MDEIENYDKWMNAIADLHWDMVIIDEAHHLAKLGGAASRQNRMLAAAATTGAPALCARAGSSRPVAIEARSVRRESCMR